MLAELPRSTRRLIEQARVLASSEGESAASTRHALLAIAAAPPNELSEHLAPLGLLTPRVVHDPHRGFQDVPISNELRMAVANAWRFAVLQQAERPAPGHLLLALLWDPDSSAAFEASSVGIVFEDARRALFPDVPLPVALRPPLGLVIPNGEPVELPADRLDEVVRELERRLPPGAPRSFNHDGKRAWVRTDARYDLQGVIADILAERDRQKTHDTSDSNVSNEQL